MDFSQLPKMSKTPTQGEPAATPEPVTDASSEPVAAPRAQTADERVRHSAYADQPYLPGSGSVLISLIAGVIFFAMGQTFARFLLAKLAGREFVTGWLQPDGVTPVRYFELQGGTAYSDMGFFLMGAALLFDAAVLGLLAAQRSPKTGLVWITVALTTIAMLINVGVVFYLFGIGIMPLMSIIAILIGGFMLHDHLPLLKRRA